jgi:2,3-dihydroxy-2,3-dihydro-p-cumate dehydrogenase
MKNRHDGRVAIVTGAGRGIGLEIALRLARDGARLALGDVSEATLRETSVRIEAEFEKPVAVAGDLSLEEAADLLIQATLERFGRIDILVNNAGGGVIRPFLEHTAETLHQTIDRNLWTTIWCTRAVLPSMLERGYGRIVNIGADSVRSGLWAHAGYNAAKGGVHGMTTGLAREFARTGVTINTIAPCAVNTPQLAELFARDDSLKGPFLDVIPMGRPGEMAEVASMVSYLAAEEASFVTGQVISVNGAATMP